VLKPSIAPWLAVSDGAKAIEFYQAAFGAKEVYHLDDPGGGVVSRLEIDGGEFWLSGDPPQAKSANDASSAAPKVRMIWTVADPDAAFARALAAGASEVFPVSEGYGWRVGRLVDPFGHHWEIGHQLE
jgi:PhnB protein